MTGPNKGVSKFQALSAIFAAALGFSLLFVIATSKIVDSLFNSGGADVSGLQTAVGEGAKPVPAETKAEAPIVPSEPAASADTPPAPAATPQADAALAAEAEAAQPFGKLLASADAAKGEAVAKKCIACHTFDKGGKAKVGPNLYGIVGRRIANFEGFAYSPAMQGYAAEAKTWTYEQLEVYLRKPAVVVPKTKMAFAGIGRDKELADLIAYLRMLSDTPLPMPTN